MNLSFRGSLSTEWRLHHQGTEYVSSIAVAVTPEAAQEHCNYVVLVPTLGSGRCNVVKEDRECTVQATKMQRKFCCGEATSPGEGLAFSKS